MQIYEVPQRHDDERIEIAAARPLQDDDPDLRRRSAGRLPADLVEPVGDVGRELPRPLLELEAEHRGLGIGAIPLPGDGDPRRP